MDRGITALPFTTQIDTALMSREDLLNFRRSLLGALAIIDLALSQPHLTSGAKERKG